MKRKGWHRKKRRLRHDHKAQALGTLRNHCRSHFAKWAETLFSAEESMNPMLAAFKAHRRSGKPTMLAVRLRYLDKKS